MSYATQKRLLLFVFLSLPLTLLFMFLVYPAGRLIMMSFTDWDGVVESFEFIGLGNYREAFASENIWTSLRNNGIYAVFGLVQNILALLFAVLLVDRIRGRNAFRAIIFLPYVVNSAAVAYMFGYLFDYEKSPVNVVLKLFDLEPLRFISDPNIVNFSLAGVSLWRYIGFTMVIYIAALQSVPRELYEASMLDGANGLQNFRYITLPSIRKIVELNLFLCMSGALNAFIEPLLITRGGPGYASNTFLVYIVNSAFEFNNYSLAAALSVILIAMILVITAVQNKVVSRNI